MSAPSMQLSSLLMLGSNGTSPQLSRQTSNVAPPKLVPFNVLDFDEIKSGVKRVVPSLSGG